MPTIAVTASVSLDSIVADDAQVLGVSVIGPGCSVYGRAIVRNCTLLNGAAVFGDANLTGLILDGRVIAIDYTEQGIGKLYNTRRILSDNPRFRRDELRESMLLGNNPTLVTGGAPERERP